MRKDVKVMDKEKNIVQVTTLGERWYAIPATDMKTGLPTFKYLPSVTWICDFYPKGVGFYKWLADKGWDEAEALKESAGDKGSKVHQATELIDQGQELSIDASIINPRTEQEEELTKEEVDCILSFAQFLDEKNPQLLCLETTVIGDNYAGTIDRIYRIDGEIFIVDLKTSQAIWETHKMQVSAYSHAKIDYKSMGITDDEWNKRKLAVLQVGYKKNGKGYKFTEVEDKYDLFLNAYKVWQNENPEAKPKQKDYPLILKSEVRTKGVKK